MNDLEHPRDAQGHYIRRLGAEQLSYKWAGLGVRAGQFRLLYLRWGRSAKYQNFEQPPTSSVGIDHLFSLDVAISCSQARRFRDDALTGNIRFSGRILAPRPGPHRLRRGHGAGHRACGDVQARFAGGHRLGRRDHAGASVGHDAVRAVRHQSAAAQGHAVSRRLDVERQIRRSYQRPNSPARHGSSGKRPAARLPASHRARASDVGTDGAAAIEGQ